MSPGMKRHILNILILLLASTAVLSCSDLVNEIEDVHVQATSYSLKISGSVSDIESSIPLEDIRISISATEKMVNGKEVETFLTVYTDDKGIFTTSISGFTYPISVILEADDPYGIYMSARHEIPMINWDSHYNMDKGTFYVNDCNFYLEKKK